MLDWLEEITSEDYETDITETNITSEDRDFRIVKINENMESDRMTVLGQVSVSGPILLDSVNSVTQIYGRDETARALTWEEVVPHFNEVKLVVIKDEIETIMLKKVKERSSAIFKSMKERNELSPLIYDFYRSKDRNFLGPHKMSRTIKHFSVHIHKLEPIHLEETATLQQVIEHSYFFRKKVLMLSPTGWVLEDELRYSVTLRFLASFCSKLWLLVDADDMKVVGVDAI